MHVPSVAEHGPRETSHRADNAIHFQFPNALVSMRGVVADQLDERVGWLPRSVPGFGLSPGHWYFAAPAVRDLSQFWPITVVSQQTTDDD